jgi:hypothetical protein
VGSLSKLRTSLTYSNVMATIAVFVAMSGGAYAISIPRSSVGSKQLKRNAVIAAKIKKGAITSVKVKDRSLTARDLEPGLLPAWASARADDTDPPPVPGTVIKQTSIRMTASGKIYVLATLRDIFLTCSSGGPCSVNWGVFVDDKPVPDTGVQLQAIASTSDGFPYQTLFGMTSTEAAPGLHILKLARSGSPNIESAGELGAQLGAFALVG